MPAWGLLSAKVAGGSGSAVPFGSSGYRKIVGISTYGNTHEIYIGGSGVSASTGMRLNANTLFEFGHMNDNEEDFDISKIYLFSSDTEGVSYSYLDKG